MNHNPLSQTLDDTEDGSDKEEENTSNSEIKEEVYEEDDRNEGDLSNKVESRRKIDVEKNDNQEQNTPVSSIENAENDQENDLAYQDMQRLKKIQLHDQNLM